MCHAGSFPGNGGLQRGIMFSLWSNHLGDRIQGRDSLIRFLTRSFARLGRGTLGSFFPDKCLVCGVYIREASDLAPVFDDVKILFDTALARLVCARCLEQGFTPISPPFCTCCGKPFSSSACENHLCSDCILAIEKGRSMVGRVRAFGCHEFLLRDLVHQFKYGKKIYLARPLGRFMFHTFMGHFSSLSSSSPPLSSIDLIIPVPLHISRLRQREFNQAYLLVREFPVLWTAVTKSRPGWSISNTILLRSRNTPSQTGFDRKDRLKNLRDAFTVKGKIKGKRILLIDDVYTTGATSGEAALTLLNAGALTVDLLVLVRA